MAVQEACTHCDLPIPPGERVVQEVDGRELSFCCHGCAGAYRIITGAGLGQFYERRRWTDPGTPAGAFETAYSDEYLSGFVVDSGERAEIATLVGGIRCPSCVWLVERILGDLPGVIEARINFATHRTRIAFDPERTGPSRIYAALARIGYAPRPFSADEAERAEQEEKRTLLLRFGTAAFLSLQLMGYSIALYAGYFQGMGAESRRLLQWLAGAVASPVVF